MTARLRGLDQDVALSPLHFFERAEGLFPRREIASRRQGRTVRTTFGAWAERTRRLVGGLRDLGIPPGTAVASLAWNSWEHLEVYVGVPCGGWAYHPLNPRLRPEDLARMLLATGDRVVVVERSLLPLLAATLAHPTAVEAVVLVDDGTDDPDPDPGRPTIAYEDLLRAAPASLGCDDERAAAILCHTTGTTGRAKTVSHSHRALFLQVLGACTPDAMGVGEADVVLALGPFFHSNGLNLPYLALATGAGLVLPGDERDPADLLDLLERERVTATMAVPVVMQGLLDVLGDHTLPDLRLVVVGSYDLPVAVSEAFRERLGGHVVRHGFGMSESLPPTLIGTVSPDAPPRNAGDWEALARSVGRPVLGVDVRVRPRADDAASAGPETVTGGPVPGDLELRGPWIAAGYLGSDEDVLTPDGWLPTGDLATTDERGNIRIVGRTTDLIKSGGLWIEPRQLEDLLVADTRVAEAAVFGVPHPRWGERPVAVVVAAGKTPPDPAGLRHMLGEHLPSWAVPDEVVIAESIERNTTGKVDKGRLRQAYLAGRPAT